MKVLWVPGWSFDKDLWQELAEPFLTRGEHRFISFADCRQPVDYSDRMAEETAGEWLAVAWSLGSLLALEQALVRPPKGLFLFGATGAFAAQEDSPWGWPEAMVRRLQRRLAKNQQETLEGFDRQVFAPQAPPDRMGERLPLPALTAGLEVLLSLRVLHEAESLKTPVTFYHGSEDQVCPLTGMEALAGRIADSRILLRSGEGHGSFLLDPQPAQEALRRFFDECHR